MKTYLDMDEILRHRRRYIGQEYDEPYLVSAVPEEVIRSLPPADVMEVRHGSWHKYSKGSGSYNGVIILSDAYQCTICKKSSWNKSDYCPNCGAKMDEETNE